MASCTTLLVPKGGGRLVPCGKVATHTLECYWPPAPVCGEHIRFYQENEVWQDAVRRGTATITPIVGAEPERQLSLWG